MVTKVLNQVITDYSILSKRYLEHEGFLFTTTTYPANVYNSIIIRYPENAVCSCPVLPYSKRSFEEHIKFVNKHKIEKALVIADDISFITQCPTLKYLRIIPADSAPDNFDFSPLYAMPEIISLNCATEYGHHFEKSTIIDCNKVSGVQSLAVVANRYKNFSNISTLKKIGISHYNSDDVTGIFSSKELDTLTVIQCKIKSLNGIQNSNKMQCLYLYYNRSLVDISALAHCKNTLKALRIENCSKIADFSVLSELENLELLELSGSNTLPSLDFLKSMKNLKTFIFNMNVLNGDLTPCLDLSYVYSEKNRKHYNLKDKDLPKGLYVRGNEDIEEWRRLE